MREWKAVDGGEKWEGVGDKSTGLGKGGEGTGRRNRGGRVRGRTGVRAGGAGRRSAAWEVISEVLSGEGEGPAGRQDLNDGEQVDTFWTMGGGLFSGCLGVGEEGLMGAGGGGRG